MPQNIFKIYGGANSFWQWETDQKLIVLDETIDKVHFSNKYMRRAFTSDVYVDADGLRICDIPDEMFTIPKNLIATAHDNEGVPDEIIRSVQFAVKARPIPYDYKAEQENHICSVMQFNTLDAAEKWALDTKQAGAIIAVNIDSVWTACIVGEDYSVNTVWDQEYVFDSIENLNELVGDVKVQILIENANSETIKYVDKAIDNIEIPEDYAKITDIPTKPEDVGAQPKGDYALKNEIPDVPTRVSDLVNDCNFITYEESPVQSVNGQTGAVVLDADIVGADKIGTASSMISTHNINVDAHNDIRLLITGLSERLNILANSDDTTLDQIAEIVAYIKANRNLIEQVTTGKVGVADIVNNLTTNVENKPLSAAQGVVLKELIDTILNNLSNYAMKTSIPTKVSQLQNDKGYLTDVPSGYATEEYVNEALSGFEGNGVSYVAQDTAPEDTDVLWVDTADNTEVEIGSNDLVVGIAYVNKEYSLVDITYDEIMAAIDEGKNVRAEWVDSNNIRKIYPLIVDRSKYSSSPYLVFSYNNQTNTEGFAVQPTSKVERWGTTLVPNTRKINNKPLSADITLTAADVGAIATVNGMAPDEDGNVEIESESGCSVTVDEETMMVSSGGAGTYNGEYELIKDITLEEASTVRCNDLNLKETVVEITVPVDSTIAGGNISVKFSSGKFSNSWISANSQSQYERMTRRSIYRRAGRYISEHAQYTITTNSANLQQYMIDFDELSELANETIITVMYSAECPVGTKIKIWGVRA